MKTIKRIIIKIGSSSIVNTDGTINDESLSNVIDTIATLNNLGHDCVLVTSGAIAIGASKLKLKARPKKMALKQACAAIGQVLLMNKYEQLAAKHDLICAQILVNHDDFENRSRMIHLTDTLEELFANSIIPIINENDALAVEEIKVGDNDTLSALLAPMINADLLVLASDIDGLYDKNPKEYKEAHKVDYVARVDSEIENMVGKITSTVGTGGMQTKLKAARIANNAGCNMVIINALQITKIPSLLKGEAVGTWFAAANTALHSKDHWIIYHAYAKGIITVDDGAKVALITGRKSLLPSGVVKVEGNFLDNSVVFVADMEGNKIAKGVCNFNSDEIKLIKGKKTHEIKEILNRSKDEIIHANNLVIIEGEDYGKIK